MGHFLRAGKCVQPVFSGLKYCPSPTTEIYAMIFLTNIVEVRFE